MVGDSKWEAGMAAFCKPFTKAKIQYFDAARLDEAAEWIQAHGLAASPAPVSVAEPSSSLRNESRPIAVCRQGAPGDVGDVGHLSAPRAT